MATHVECVVVRASICRRTTYTLVCGIWLNHVPGFHSLFCIDRLRSRLGRRLLHTAIVETLVKNFALVGKVTRAWLVRLR